MPRLIRSLLALALSLVAAVLVVLAWSGLVCAVTAVTGPGRRPALGRAPGRGLVTSY